MDIAVADYDHDDDYGVAMSPEEARKAESERVIDDNLLGKAPSMYCCLV